MARANICFTDKNNNIDNPIAILYRQGGFPFVVGKDIIDFFKENSKSSDSRFSDGGTLSVKMLYWLIQDAIDKFGSWDLRSLKISNKFSNDADFLYEVQCDVPWEYKINDKEVFEAVKVKVYGNGDKENYFGPVTIVK